MTLPLAEDRLNLILKLLVDKGSCRTSELARQFGTSEMTIRRDLDVLASRGLIKKVHGGATLNSVDMQFQERQQLSRGPKERIGLKARELIQPGQTIYIDAGTTAIQLALALKADPQLARTVYVVTHAINIAYELHSECKLYLIGGEAYQGTFSLVGPDAIQMIQKYNYDVFFVGACGIHERSGLTNTNLIEAQLKTEIMKRSNQKVLIADQSKWGNLGFATFAPIDAVDLWITDHLPDDARAVMQNRQVQVIEAP